ncbi:lysylphosphatidylglycerol synthase transmembrane domain-containing protein [Paractinoplanes atraurantiacus]|uniref:lysylphosphatidylglycerol synthase transmembrane domain-containing protein n=1 Tax=Paractinoplanes atraurantiacus TaxID=1036182 RepID=UPI0015CEFB02|nr:lysylphosphatidylglycerol synthase transmembrane domain-containing protein [Actinoplanes atraurantiacus]
MVIALRGRVPEPSSVASALTRADPRWLAIAVAAQLFSQAGFALQQRTLLSALSTHLTVPDALAITFSRTAMGSVLPAGSAMSAAFALQQFRRRGAPAATATTAVVLSATASMLGLATLYAATATTHLAPIRAAELTAAFIALAAGAAVFTRVRRSLPLPAAFRPSRSPAAPAGSPIRAIGSSAPAPAASSTSVAGSSASPGRVVGSATSRVPVVGEWRGFTAGRRNLAALAQHWLGRAVTQSRRMVGEAKTVHPRHWLVALGYATLNWALDLACLIAVAQACGFPLSPLQLTSVYLAVQIVRQIPITPGGIGLIEASLLTGFLAAGAPEAPAAAVVLGYRIISFWLMLPIGLATYFRLSRSQPSPSRA